MDKNLLAREIKKIPGPILIVGASGFVGANLLNIISTVRDDVYGTATRLPAWRLEKFPPVKIIETDLSSQKNVRSLLDRVKPTTIFDCVAYGGYSFEKQIEKIYHSNLMAKVYLINEIVERNIHCYIHAGTSSEYGENASGPLESSMLSPNNHYAVSKSAASNLVSYAGKYCGLRCANLRLYSAYGPLEDPSRLIPTVIDHCLGGKLPPFVNAETSRDFIYVDDVCEAFIYAANNLTPEHYGESFNIGTGCKTTIREFAELAKELYGIQEDPCFSTMSPRPWDTTNWYSNPEKANKILGWKASTSLKDGLLKTTAWFKELPDRDRYLAHTKQKHVEIMHSISAIVACYKDVQAIPIMAQRLVNVFEKCKIDYEIIFVNDSSPDDSEALIQSLSSTNPRIMGITHARNFGSQAAFRSGMEISSKSACVLLDGDLQDPPELIEQFIEKWLEGYDVVYGIRVKREGPLFMQIAYKLFYRLFNWFSEVPIPHDAGDFSLLDKRIVAWLLACNERDLFLRGLRAYIGFKQTGVPYTRPERMFGRTTNNFLKNIGWAKKGIISFSKVPLNILTAAGILLTGLTAIIATLQIAAHFFFPQSAPKGITSVMLLIMFFGSLTIFSISLLGEYIAKIFEEVKARPHYVRKHIIKNGLISSCLEKPAS